MIVGRIRAGMMVCFMGGSVTSTPPQKDHGCVQKDCVEISGAPSVWVVIPDVLSGFSLGWGANSLCFGSADGAVNTTLWSHKHAMRENNCRIQSTSSNAAKSCSERCYWIVADRDIAAGEEILVRGGDMYSNECERNGSVQDCMSVFYANMLKNREKVKGQSVGASKRPSTRPVGRPPKVAKLHGRAKTWFMNGK
jgi:hypothetical protein